MDPLTLGVDEAGIRAWRLRLRILPTFEIVLEVTPIAPSRPFVVFAARLADGQCLLTDHSQAGVQRGLEPPAPPMRSKPVPLGSLALARKAGAGRGLTA